MKISDHVAMLEIAGNGGSIYPTLLWDDDHLVLIDTGYPGQTEVIRSAIVDEGFCLEDLTEIILTHQDIDHIGCLPDLLKAAPKAGVLAHIEEAPYIDGRKTPIKLASMLEKYDTLSDDQKAWCDRLKVGFANRSVPITHHLTDGEVLAICGGIEVFHAPGHTPGHICLFLRGSRIMVGGDALNIADGQLTGPNPQYTYDIELGLRSFEKAKAFDMRGVVSYHCGYWGAEESRS